MNNNEHLKFIDKLSQDLTPVKVHWSAEKRALLWVTLHASLITLAMFLTGPFRVSSFSELLNSHLFVETLMFIAAFGVSGYFSYLSLVPGAFKTHKFKYSLIPIATLVGHFLYSSLQTHGHTHQPMMKMRNFCEVEILMYAVIPLLHFFVLAKRGMFYDYKWPLVLISMSSALIPAAIMHFACAYNYKHILILHVGPVAFFTVVTLGLVKFTNLKNLLK